MAHNENSVEMKVHDTVYIKKIGEVSYQKSVEHLKAQEQRNKKKKEESTSKSCRQQEIFKMKLEINKI